MHAKEEMLAWDKLEPLLVQIEEAAINSDTKKTYKLLNKIVPQFNPASNDLDFVHKN